MGASDVPAASEDWTAKEQQTPGKSNRQRSGPQKGMNRPGMSAVGTVEKPAGHDILGGQWQCRTPKRRSDWSGVLCVYSIFELSVNTTSGAPSIPRPLRNGWETTDIHRNCKHHGRKRSIASANKYQQPLGAPSSPRLCFCG
jgi:hypothetical protein